MTTQYWTEEVKENYGHWSVKHNIVTTFSLIDAKTNKAVVFSIDNDSDDRITDAYRHNLAEFYEKVNDYFKERGLK